MYSGNPTADAAVEMNRWTRQYKESEPDYTCLCCGMGFYKGEGVIVDNHDYFFRDCNWKAFVRDNYDTAMSKEEIEIRIAEAVLV